MRHPYAIQPKRAFWKGAVGDTHPLHMSDWYKAKFSIAGLRIGTAGSCFAQHIGRNLRAKGFKYVDVEPAPSFMAGSLSQDYSYGIYSARYGNIYTTRQLLQTLQRCLGSGVSADAHIWAHRGGFVDAFRPTLEPDPFPSKNDVIDARLSHLVAVRKLFEGIEVFVFTLGLTETWVSKNDGYVYPICPGVSGGEYDAKHYDFLNLRYNHVVDDLESFFEMARKINNNLKFILTVSPVPLMATATSNHVVVATTESKAILRAAAGYLSAKYEWVDYFPSYEIISSTPMKSFFFNPDMRTVSQAGVDHVMSHFFKEHSNAGNEGADAESAQSKNIERNEDDVKCDEELLAAFGEKK